MLLARRLAYTYIDTGAMYRVVALQISRNSLSPDDETPLRRLLSSLQIAFIQENERIRVLCNGEDVTAAIRSPEISLLASDVSRRKLVREALVRMQREMGAGGGVVMEGRDIGTVVFPEADVKFYLDADVAERARRRFDELVQKGTEVDFETTLEEVVRRDRGDMERTVSPLRKAGDAIRIDSTARSVAQVVEDMARIVRERAGAS